jgi:hypothetical protein
MKQQGVPAEDAAKRADLTKHEELRSSTFAATSHHDSTQRARELIAVGPRENRHQFRHVSVHLVLDDARELPTPRSDAEVCCAAVVR